MTAKPTLTLAGCEALALFLADRYELWKTHAKSCGADPDAVAKALCVAHGKGVKAVADKGNKPVKP